MKTFKAFKHQKGCNNTIEVFFTLNPLIRLTEILRYQSRQPFYGTVFYKRFWALKGWVHPKMKNSVINYSPSCGPTCETFVHVQNTLFLMKSKSFWPSIARELTRSRPRKVVRTSFKSAVLSYSVLTKSDMQNMQSGGTRGLELWT